MTKEQALSDLIAVTEDVQRYRVDRDCWVRTVACHQAEVDKSKSELDLAELKVKDGERTLHHAIEVYRQACVVPDDSQVLKDGDAFTVKDGELVLKEKAKGNAPARIEKLRKVAAKDGVKLSSSQVKAMDEKPWKYNKE